MTAPSSVETTLERLTSRVGAPRAGRLIRRGDEIVAGFAVWCHDGGDFDLTDLRTAQLVLALSGGQHAEVRGPASYRRHETTAGDIRLVVPRLSPRITITGRAATLQIVLADALIAAAAAGPANLCVNPRALAAQALVALRSDADDERCGRIALHAARRIAAVGSGAPARTLPARGGLAPQALRRVCELMRSRLAATPDHLPDCDELAGAAALSKFHFIRAFRDSTGLTPRAWMMERRMALAYALLLDGGATKVGDVAEQTGFASPAHFVSTFRGSNGLTPAVLRDSASALLAAA